MQEPEKLFQLIKPFDVPDLGPETCLSIAAQLLILFGSVQEHPLPERLKL